jgi:hypothetical protein
MTPATLKKRLRFNDPVEICKDEFEPREASQEATVKEDLTCASPKDNGYKMIFFTNPLYHQYKQDLVRESSGT